MAKEIKAGLAPYREGDEDQLRKRKVASGGGHSKEQELYKVILKGDHGGGHLIGKVVVAKRIKRCLR